MGEPWYSSISCSTRRRLPTRSASPNRSSMMSPGSIFNCHPPTHQRMLEEGRKLANVLVGDRAALHFRDDEAALDGVEVEAQSAAGDELKAAVPSQLPALVQEAAVPAPTRHPLLALPCPAALGPPPYLRLRVNLTREPSRGRRRERRISPRTSSPTMEPSS